jgi:hypothetical protein
MKHDDDGLKKKKILNLIDNLFGNPDELPEEELDALYQQIGAKRDPKEWVRSLAQEAARSYRLKQRNVPNHVQAILDATSERSIQDAKPSEMKNLIDSLLGPNPQRNFRASIAFRKQPGSKLSEKDRKLLDGLVGEIEEKGKEEP